MSPAPHFQREADVAVQAIDVVIQDRKHGPEIWQTLKNGVPINMNDLIIEELPALVEPSDDDEMDLTSEVTSPSCSCGLIWVSNLKNTHAQLNERHENSHSLECGIQISTLVHSNHDNITINNDSNDDDIPKVISRKQKLTHHEMTQQKCHCDQHPIKIHRAETLTWHGNQA